MQSIVYVRDSKDIPIYEQFNKCANYAKKNGYSISGKVLDFDGKRIHEAINKVISGNDINALIVYSRDTAFSDYEEMLFYQIYLTKQNKILVIVN